MTTASTPHLIRPAEPSDQPVLWDILYEALWDPPAAPRRPRSVLSSPHIAIYVENWGSQETDLGFLAISPNGSVAGGILSRLLLPPSQGGAFYDDHTAIGHRCVFRISAPRHRDQLVHEIPFCSVVAVPARIIECPSRKPRRYPPLQVIRLSAIRHRERWIPQHGNSARESGRTCLA
jgi:hypothetical protein